MIRSENRVLKGIRKYKQSIGICTPALKLTAKMKPKIILVLSMMALFASCLKKPGSYPPEPQIYHLSTRPNTLNLNDTISTVKIELKFTDGDGDIGTDEKQETQNIYIRSSKDTSTTQDYTYRLNFPYIADYMRPSGGGLEGFFTVNLNKQFFTVSDSFHLAVRKDTFTWDIYIMDNAGHKSNVVTSDPIYVEF